MHSHPRYLPPAEIEAFRRKAMQEVKRANKERIQELQRIEGEARIQQQLRKKRERDELQKKLKNEIEFDQDAFNYYYRRYPEPRKGKAPRDEEKYPSPRYPYPDTNLWTGEPSYPNDRDYPDFLFPPQPPMYSEKEWPTDDEIDWKAHVYPSQWPEKRIPHALMENSEWLDPQHLAKERAKNLVSQSRAANADYFALNHDTASVSDTPKKIKADFLPVQDPNDFLASKVRSLAQQTPAPEP